MRQIAGLPALAVLRNRDFRILWNTRAIHEVSRRMEILVLGYLILKLTDDPFQVGLIAVSLNAPRPMLSLFAGVIADRLDRRRVMVGAHAVYAGTAAVLLALLITDLVQPWQVFIVIFLQGSAKVLDDPSRRTAVFDLAGPGRIANAMSLDTISNNGGKILGPLAGGLLIANGGKILGPLATGLPIARIDFVAAYAVLLALDLVALLLMVRLRLPHQEQADRQETTVWRSLWEGLGQSVTNPMVRGVLCISLVVNALVFPIQYFIPVIADDMLEVGPKLGGLLGAAEGIGTLIGASMIAVRRDIRYHGRLFVAGAVIVSVAVTLVAWSPWFTLSFALLLLGGVAQAGFSTMQSTILLLASQPDVRGRTVGALGVVNGLGHLVGGWEIGALASASGIGLAIGLNAGVGLLLILPVIVVTPLVWRPVTGMPKQAHLGAKPLPTMPLANPGADPRDISEVESRGNPLGPQD